MSRAIQSQFNKTGYALEKGVFTDAEIEILENEFDQIVTQLKKSGENVNARWGSDLTRHIEDSDSEVIHTTISKAIHLSCLTWSKMKHY